MTHCLDSVVAQDIDNLRVIVSDNLSSDSTRDVVESKCDSRITYINSGERLSMSHNWEFALSHVEQGVVGFVGDDDGLVPGALGIVSDVMDHEKCDLLSGRAFGYTWPGVYEEAAYGRLDWRKGALFPGMHSNIDVMDSREALREVLQGKGTYLDLAPIYAGGFASLDLINRARNHKGRFFLSQNPDVYSAVALAKVAGRFVRSNQYLYVSGCSKHSTG